MLRWDDGTVTLSHLLDLERIEENLFRANLVFAERPNENTGRTATLYGGQVAAQALLAAGRTVAADRAPHSLHGYFLRPGDPQLPTVFTVFRDRDGRSFSARRVVAIQNGAVIFNMSASFQTPDPTPVQQSEQLPDVPAPEDTPAAELFRLFSIDYRCPDQRFPDAEWPTRFWARCTDELPADDALLQACALTYISDVSSGVLPLPDRSVVPTASLDHAVWFHGPVDLTDWLLSDYEPRVTGHGRGWYTGSVFDRHGALVASLTQECLFR